MKEKVDMYVCSKPLQYFNVRNLPRNATKKNVLVIEDKFKDAYRFYESVLKYDKSWNKIHYTDDRSKIFKLCMFTYKVNNLYYYLDFMLTAASFLYAVPCKNLFIYEEGISAYRTDIFKNTAGYKRKIRNVFGFKEYPGFHRKAKAIYVYDREKYLKIFSAFREKNKLHPLSFNTSFEQMLEDNINLALKIFEFDADHIFENVQNKKVLLYITTWPFTESSLKNINADEYDYWVIKPHPHIRELNLPQHWKSSKTIVIDSVILAEFLIKILIDRNNRLDIYHHNSSAAMYINQHPNINAVISI